jgi:hypothetical protein
MASRRDQGLVRTATMRRPRWNVPEAKRQDLKAKLDRALDQAEHAGDYEGVFSGVKTYLGMAAQDQADDHLQDKNDRLDTGKLTENAGLTFNIVPVEPPNESQT